MYISSVSSRWYTVVCQGTRKWIEWKRKWLLQKRKSVTDNERWPVVVIEMAPRKSSLNSQTRPDSSSVSKSRVFWPYVKCNRKESRILAFTFKFIESVWPNTTVTTHVFTVTKLLRGNLKSIIFSWKILFSLKNTYKCITTNCFGIASNSFPTNAMLL